MGDGRDVVDQLYQCFALRDGDGMAALYAEDAVFSDPVFPSLRGAEIGAMWRMLTGRSQDLDIKLEDVEGGGESFLARWTARYTFTATGRKVTNRVTSAIQVRGDRIAAQRDSFDFPLWQAQALGNFGRLLGWSGLPGMMIRRKAAQNLAAFRAKHR
jgi:ketosteroid isomerase-like protein